MVIFGWPGTLRQGHVKLKSPVMLWVVAEIFPGELAEAAWGTL
jgi:hypothetical protein